MNYGNNILTVLNYEFQVTAALIYFEMVKFSTIFFILYLIPVHPKQK